MKIWLINRFIYYWDVVFTSIDNWQLRRYISLKEYKQGLIENEDARLSNYLDEMEEFKEWEDL